MLDRFERNQNWAKLTPWLGALSFALLFLFFKPADVIFWSLINIPLYLLHQCEEHYLPGGFKDYMNQSVLNLPQGEEKITDRKIFWINILLVWAAFLLFGAASFYHPGFGLFLVVFSILNCITHIFQGMKHREWNPGLVMASVQFSVSVYAAWFITSHGLVHPALWWTAAILGSAAVHAFVFHLILSPSTKKKSETKGKSL